MMEQVKIGMFGLGYVELPLVVEFGRQCPTAGFDINLNQLEAAHEFGIRPAAQTETGKYDAAILAIV